MKDMKMFAYLSKVKKLQYEFEEFSIEQLLKNKNSDADALPNQTIQNIEGPFT